MSLADTVVNALTRIHERVVASERAPVKSLRCPDYAFVDYRGYRCGALKCIALNTAWVGFVLVPPERPLVWPDDSYKRPFRVGIDFDTEYAGNRLIGFHTRHLQDDTSFRGVGFSSKSVDYVILQLRHFIDECCHVASSEHPSRH